MKTWKSKQDLLVDQTLALLKAAIDDESKPSLPLTEPSSAASIGSLKTMSDAEIAVDRTNQMEHDPLVEDILSLIEHVAVSEPKANEPTLGPERQNIEPDDEITRMTLELDALRKRVTSFKEAQQRFLRDREKSATTAPNADGAAHLVPPFVGRIGTI
jgi:hypothetical protein